MLIESLTPLTLALPDACSLMGYVNIVLAGASCASTCLTGIIVGTIGVRLA
jgi:hypothetical protein